MEALGTTGQGGPLTGEKYFSGHMLESMTCNAHPCPKEKFNKKSGPGQRRGGVGVFLFIGRR